MRPGDSAAAIVTISVPMKVNIVVSIAAITPLQPFGMKPSDVRWETPDVCEPGNRPKIANRPTPMNATIATTFTSANQNSNSP